MASRQFPTLSPLRAAPAPHAIREEEPGVIDDHPDSVNPNPTELGEQHLELLETLTEVNILGGCCGTDHRHVDAIFQACRSC